MATLNMPLDKLEEGPIKDCLKSIKDWADNEEKSLLSSVGLKVQVVTGIIDPSLYTTDITANGEIAAAFGRAESTTVPPVRWEVMSSNTTVSFDAAPGGTRLGIRTTANRPLRYKILILYRG